MFNLSKSVSNLYIFDSHALIVDSFSNARPDSVWEPGRRIDGKFVGGNGIHLTLTVKKLVTRELVNAVGMLAGLWATRFRNCRWLRNSSPCSSTRWAG